MPTIKANDIDLYYEVHGEGEPLVMIAGFSGDHTAFDALIETYAKDYQVIVFDNRGVGQSDVPDYAYTIDMMAKDTVDLLSVLNIKKAHVFGHSMGTAVAQTMAYQYPDRVESIILANAFPYSNMRLRLYGEVRLELIRAGAPEESIIKFVSMLCWSDRYLSQAGTIENLINIGFPQITEEGYKNQLNALLTFDSRKWLDKINTPCLIINGDDDLIVHIEQGELMKNTIPNVFYHCFHDVGHVVFLERMDEFNQLVFGFLKNNSFSLAVCK